MKHACTFAGDNTKETAESINRRRRAREKRNSRASECDSRHETVKLDVALSLVDLATPISHVSAFCQAVFKRILPNELWGTGEAGSHNKSIFLKHVDRFIKLRRFESMNLHDMMQGLKVAPHDDAQQHRDAVSANQSLLDRWN